MIFVTVGTQLPFDRLVATVDLWVQNSDDKNIKVFGQIGNSNIIPKNFSYSEFISLEQLESFHKEANLIVAHAGMGSILTALKYKKPIIIMPRLRQYNEHRNNHQLSTVERFNDINGVIVAKDEEDLVAKLQSFKGLDASEINFSEVASTQLIENIIGFIEDE